MARTRLADSRVPAARVPDHPRRSVAGSANRWPATSPRRWCSRRSIVAVLIYFDLLGMDEDERSSEPSPCSRGCRSASCRSTWRSSSIRCRSRCVCSSPASAGLIHLFAVGYMHGDPKFSKFFLYLNLFILSMTLLVLGIEPARHLPRLGRCRHLLVPPDLVLAHQGCERPPPARRRSSPTASVTSA